MNDAAGYETPNGTWIWQGDRYPDRESMLQAQSEGPLYRPPSKLTVYRAAKGFFIAPLGDYSTVADALVQRVSPFYADQGRAYAACDEKQHEYDAES